MPLYTLSDLSEILKDYRTSRDALERTFVRQVDDAIRKLRSHPWLQPLRLLPTAQLYEGQDGSPESPYAVIETEIEIECRFRGYAQSLNVPDEGGIVKGDFIKIWIVGGNRHLAVRLSDIDAINSTGATAHIAL